MTTLGIATNAAPLSTDGIDINKWNLPMDAVNGEEADSIELSAWDFAGQEIYYATHQFFLSNRSIFLVIFNLLAPTQSRVEYWYVHTPTWTIKQLPHHNSIGYSRSKQQRRIRQ